MLLQLFRQYISAASQNLPSLSQTNRSTVRIAAISPLPLQHNHYSWQQRRKTACVMTDISRLVIPTLTMQFYSSLGSRAVHYDERVCLSVCLFVCLSVYVSVREHIAPK